jgi:hypothetical protein
VPWQSYFYVWSPAGFKPTRRHETEDGARGQAAQLRGKFPDQEFFVYRAERLETEQPGKPAVADIEDP